MPAVRYVKPSLGTRVFNAVPSALARVGISIYGSRILAVRGRKSGAWRTVPVNLLIHDGVQYLVAPRGETQWVRNLRAIGSGELRLGRRREAFRAVELRDGDKPAILGKASLKRVQRNLESKITKPTVEDEKNASTISWLWRATCSVRRCWVNS